MSKKNFVSYADEEVLMTEIGEKIKSGDTYKMFLGVYNPVTDEFVDPNTGTNIEKVLGAPYHDMITGQYFMGVPYSGGGISFYPVRNSIYSASSTSMSQMTKYYGNFAIVDVKWYNTDDNLTYEPVFTVVDSPSGNPKTQGWYEGATTPFSQTYYTPTSDTSVQSGKTYYSFKWKEVIADLDPKEITVDYSNIISIADAFPKAAKDVKLKVEAVQDLHGYDKPWVGGAGKNLFDPSAYSSYKQSDGSYRLTGSQANAIRVNVPKSLVGVECTASIYLDLSKETAPTQVYICATVSGTTSYGNRIGANSEGVTKITFTPQSVSDTIGLTFGSEGSNYFTMTDLQLEKGSEVTGYEPYTNICPISGWDNAKVTRGGKNLYSGNKHNITDTPNGLTAVFDENGNVTVNGTATSITWIAFNTPVSQVFNIPSGNYILNGIEGGSSSTYHLQLVDRGVDDTADVRTYVAYDGDVAVKIDNTHKYILQIVVRNGQTLSNKKFYPMIRPASITDPTYELYQGKEITISLNGTRYGGTHDATTGESTITWGYVDLGTLSWTMGTDNVFYTSSITNKKLGQTNIICSDYEPTSDSVANMRNGTCRGHVEQNLFYVRDTRYTDAAAFKTAMSGVQLVYELATPQTIQLTAEEVDLLQGNNTLFGDTGDISLTYAPATLGNVAEEVGELEERVSEVEGDIATIEGDVTTHGSQIQALTNYVAENNVKNILQNDATSKTENGVTFTVNADGNVTVVTESGGATARTTLQITDTYFSFNKNYIVSGCPAGGSASTYYLAIRMTKNTTWYRQQVETGAGYQFTDTDLANANRAVIQIIIESGTVITTPITFKPMITEAFIPDSDYAHYQPYAKTNVELTQASAINGITISLNSDNFATTSGTLQSGSVKLVAVGGQLVNIEYMDIRLSSVDENTNPTITITDDKLLAVSAFNETIPPTLRGADQSPVISNGGYCSHANNTNTMTIGFFNYIGTKPAGYLQILK